MSKVVSIAAVYSVICPHCDYCRRPQARHSAKISRTVHRKVTGHRAKITPATVPPSMPEAETVLGMMSSGMSMFKKRGKELAEAKTA